MKPTKYIRKGNKIHPVRYCPKTLVHLANGAVMEFKHINEAKRESRQLQLTEDGALGLGSVVVGS